MRTFGYRLRNAISLATIITFTGGLGVSLIALFLPIGWPGLSKTVAQGLTYAGIGVVLFSIGLSVWRFFANPIEKKARIYSVISILSQMEKRLWRLAEQQNMQTTDWKRYKGTSDKIIRLSGIGLPKAVNMDEAKRETERAENEIASMLEKWQSVARYVKIQWARSLTRLLDRDGFGVKKQRVVDKTYNKLKRMVDGYYDEYKNVVDKKLKKLVDSHVSLAESSANILLVKRRLEYVMTQAATRFPGIDDVLSPNMQSQIEGFEDDIKEILGDIRVDVSRYIKHLAKGGDK